MVMANARRASELRRWSDLARIRRAISETVPEFADASIGLKEVAELCRRRAASRPGRDRHAVRDQILKIGCEWDLASDRLDDQPEACLDCVARFLKSAAVSVSVVLGSSDDGSLQSGTVHFAYWLMPRRNSSFTSGSCTKHALSIRSQPLSCEQGNAV
jgi:hypothetical protein